MSIAVILVLLVFSRVLSVSWLPPLLIAAVIAWIAFVLHRAAAKQDAEEDAKRARQCTAAQQKAQIAAQRADEKRRREAERAEKKAARDAEAAEKAAAKLENARQIAECMERAAAAKREMNGRPQAAQKAAPDEPKRPGNLRGNNAFAGQTVAFTGKLKDMTRAEAIQAVEKNGGRAFVTMPAGTTLLVVGENPGMDKLDKADRWIGQLRKITQAQFAEMLKAPLTCTPEEFASVFAKSRQIEIGK